MSVTDNQELSRPNLKAKTIDTNWCQVGTELVPKRTIPTPYGSPVRRLIFQGDPVQVITKDNNSDVSRRIADVESNLKARDAQAVELAVRAEAAKRGIVDEDVVKTIDTSGIRVHGGVPDREEIAQLVESHATAKPHYYKSTQGRKSAGRDWALLNDSEFRTEEERLRAGR